jgi:hypothetical protein
MSVSAAGRVLGWWKTIASVAKEAEGLMALAGLVFVVLAAKWTYAQVETAETSAKAATDALAMQKQSSILQDRPWLVSETAAFPREIQANQAYRVEWRIKNVGRLPAINIKVRTRPGLVPMNANLDLDLDKVQGRNGLNGSLTVLGPGESKPLLAAMELTPQDVEDLQAARSRLYAIGEVLYESPDNSRGVLTFCVYYDAMFKAWPDCEIFNDVR